MGALVVLVSVLWAAGAAQAVHRQDDLGRRGQDSSRSDVNPFARTQYEASGSDCLALTLNSSESGNLEKVRVENSCDYSMAILTAPLEIRVRLTGDEPLTNERMLRSPYAILYVFPRGLGDRAFQGDGAARDGGLSVTRPPDYATVGPKTTIEMPIECRLDLPRGEYSAVLFTYQAEQRQAEERVSGFSCSRTVLEHNLHRCSKTRIALGADARELQGFATVSFSR